MTRKLLAILIVLVGIAGCDPSAKYAGPANSFTPAQQEFLRTADTIILYSLEPRDRVPSGSEDDRKNPEPEQTAGVVSFRSWPVLGQAAITDSAERRSLLEALDQGLLKARVDIRPACGFSPRHALHAERDGKSLDVLVCFECGVLKIIDDDGTVTWHEMATSAGSVFRNAVTRAGLPSPRTL